MILLVNKLYHNRWKVGNRQHGIYFEVTAPTRSAARRKVRELLGMRQFLFS